MHINGKSHDTKVIVVLDNIRSAFNVGAIFRTCDAAGVSKIYLVGTTPSPVDRFGRPVKEIAKTALGAEQTVPWEYESHISDVLTKLKQEGYIIVSVEQHSDAQNYKNIPLDMSRAYIFGNEVDGVSEEALDASDLIAEIPMKGSKESLNVSVSVGIVLYA